MLVSRADEPSPERTHSPHEICVELYGLLRTGDLLRDKFACKKVRVMCETRQRAQIDFLHTCSSKYCIEPRAGSGHLTPTTTKVEQLNS